MEKSHALLRVREDHAFCCSGEWFGTFAGKTGNLNSLRTWADLRDAVRARYMLATVNLKASEYYNICGTFSCSVEDMLRHLMSISTHKDVIKVETEQARMRPLDADLQVPDTAKFQAYSRWETEITFEETMQDLLDYWPECGNAGRFF